MMMHVAIPRVFRMYLHLMPIIIMIMLVYISFIDGVNLLYICHLKASRMCVFIYSLVVFSML